MSELYTKYAQGIVAEFEAKLEAERRARQKAELLAKQYREALNAKHEHSRGEDAAVWYWQPDGDNNLDTLSCPVVIPAQWLRDLLAAGQEAEAQAAQMREVLALLGQQPMWAQDDSNDNWTTCAMCGRQNGEHNEDCSLATALATDAGKRMLAVVEAARRWQVADVALDNHALSCTKCGGMFKLCDEASLLSDALLAAEQELRAAVGGA